MTQSGRVFYLKELLLFLRFKFLAKVSRTHLSNSLQLPLLECCTLFPFSHLGLTMISRKEK